MRSLLFFCITVIACGVVQGCGGGGSGGNSSTNSSPSTNLPLWADDPCNSATELGLYDDVMFRWEGQSDAVPYEAGRAVFTGSSSIRFWERLQEDLSDWAPVQRGFGGSVMWDVVEYIDEAVIHHKPGAVFLFEGSNDIAVGFTPEEVAEAYRCVVERIAESLGDEVSIHFIAITPTPARWTVWPESDKANQLIKAIAEDWPGLHFIDTAPAFLATGEPPDDSLFMPDGLHLSDKGYAIWRDEIFPHLSATEQHFPVAADFLASGTRILVDLGPSNPEDGAPTTSPDALGNHWNNWYPTEANELMSAGEHIGNLVDTTGQPTQLRLVFAASSHSSRGTRDGGLLEPEPGLLGEIAVSTATQDYIFVPVSNVIFEGRGALTIEGLDPLTRYSLRFFASREALPLARTRYTVTGRGGPLAAELTVSGAGSGHDSAYDGNDSEIAELNDLEPDPSGRLHIDFESVEQSTGSTAYLSLFELLVQ